MRAAPDTMRARVVTDQCLLLIIILQTSMLTKIAWASMPVSERCIVVFLTFAGSLLGGLVLFLFLSCFSIPDHVQDD